ncbi:MAG: patatin-like phospholipase family protein [Gemmatimonadetes bacterium]|nr:patatin-like phospholipase family protein [Gemmatimonadota bacterium]
MRYLVLCGGGSRGAIEVGFAKALWERGVRFDGIVGSSVGALNGAFLAAGGSPEQLADIWRTLRFKDVFRFNWRLLVRGVRARSMFTLGRSLRSLIDRLGVRRFEQLSIPLAVVATDLATGAAVVIDKGSLAPALAASVAIPGLLSPVVLGGRCLVDGSLSADLPVAEAVRRGASEIWAMRCACCASPKYRFDSLTSIIAQVFGLAVDRTRREAEVARPGVVARVWSVEAELDVSSLDFSATAALITAAYEETSRRLDRLGLAGMDVATVAVP